MRIVRSWPATAPPHRNHVVDQLPRVLLTDHDYRPLVGLGDVIVVEWDIAVAREHLDVFARMAESDRSRVLVAPYRLYRRHGARWAHRRWDGQYLASALPVTEGQTCHLFGFGMVYLPGLLVDRFVASGWSDHFGDVEFSVWHHRHITAEVDVAWNVRPVHLNYEWSSDG